jgi:hypothetical protein
LPRPVRETGSARRPLCKNVALPQHNVKSKAKSTAKKSAAKKSASKQTTAKKTTAKKSTAKKTASKKS